MRLAGAWMTEKYFAATPFRCHNAILEKHKIMLRATEYCIMAYGLIQLKLKDFEGMYAPAHQRQLHFWGSYFKNKIWYT